jgi:hypothetical protein
MEHSAGDIYDSLAIRRVIFVWKMLGQSVVRLRDIKEMTDEVTEQSERDDRSSDRDKTEDRSRHIVTQGLGR